MSDYRAGDKGRDEERLDRRMKWRGETGIPTELREKLQRQALLDHESFGVNPYNAPQPGPSDPGLLDLLKRRLMEQQPQPSEPKFMPHGVSWQEKIRGLFA